MAKFDYNLMAIGAGAAGLITCYIGAAAKAKVALIEKSKMGGDCLNTGCVPSKALLSSAKAAKMFRDHHIYGIEDVHYQVNFAKVMEQVQMAIQKVEPHDSVERYTKLGVDCIQGEAKILSPHEVIVNGKTWTTRNIVIATGARPVVPPIPGLEEIDYLHSENLWTLRELPKRLLIVGGGPIGCEMAQAFARLGAQVTLVDQLPTILPKEDKDVVGYLLPALEDDGVTIITDAKIQKIINPSRPQLIYEKGGDPQTLDFDKILLATGRQANTDGLGLDALDIGLNAGGTIQVDEVLRTTIPNIYACGDVAGPYQFTHMATHQAWYCAVNAMLSPFKTFKVDYSVVPWCTYTDPEIARVGLSEAEAQAKQIPYDVARYELNDLDRAITDRVDQGVVKVLTPPKSDKILGAAICGHHAGDLLAEYCLAMKHGLGLNKLLSTIHPYPTLAEANKLVAGQWKRKHISGFLLKVAEQFHRLRRMG